jgi:hypothetical protein
VVARQVVKRVESIEMVYWKGRDRFWWCKPKIDGDAPAPICFELKSAPTKHAAAFRAKENLQFRVSLANARVRSTQSRNTDTSS